MKRFKVQIVSCNGTPHIWYAGKMGQEFIANTSPRCPNKLKVNDILYLRKEHCKVISEIDEYGNDIDDEKDLKETFDKRDERIRSLISKGKTTRDVAKIMKVSLSTVSIAVHLK